MTIEDQITALLAQAEPLRLLPDAESEAQGLPRIVDAINALRAAQAGGQVDAEVVPDHKLFLSYDESGIAADKEKFEAEREEARKRRPGRPRKSPAEGADA